MTTDPSPPPSTLLAHRLPPCLHLNLHPPTSPTLSHIYQAYDHLYAKLSFGSEFSILNPECGRLRSWLQIAVGPVSLGDEPRYTCTVLPYRAHSYEASQRQPYRHASLQQLWIPPGVLAPFVTLPYPHTNNLHHSVIIHLSSSTPFRILSTHP